MKGYQIIINRSTIKRLQKIQDPYYLKIKESIYQLAIGPRLVFFQFNLNKSRQHFNFLIKTYLNMKSGYCPKEKAQNYNAEDCKEENEEKDVEFHQGRRKKLDFVSFLK